MSSHALLWESLLARVAVLEAVLESRRLFDAGSALRWKRRYAAGSATVTAFTQSLIRACIICLSRS